MITRHVHRLHRLGTRFIVFYEILCATFGASSFDLLVHSVPPRRGMIGLKTTRNRWWSSLGTLRSNLQHWQLLVSDDLSQYTQSCGAGASYVSREHGPDASRCGHNSSCSLYRLGLSHALGSGAAFHWVRICRWCCFLEHCNRRSSASQRED